MGSDNGRLSCWCLLLVALALHCASVVTGAETSGTEVSSAAASEHQHEAASSPSAGEEDDLDWEYLSPGGVGGLFPSASKRAYYVSEYKRLPVYNFGLGKRSPPANNKYYAFGLGKRERGGRQYSFGLGKRPNNLYSFGLGKRSMDLSPPDNAFEDDDTEDEYEPYIDEDDTNDDLMSEEKRAAGPYAFGLGKRYGKNQAYSFGLGKRAPKYSFGLGKRLASGGRQYNFGLGKRTNKQYSFGLGKREISKEEMQAYQQEQKKAAGRMYGFGLGKRAPAVSSSN